MESGQPAAEPAVPSEQLMESAEPELMNEPLETFEVECAEGEHELQTPWSWWFDKKMKNISNADLTAEDFKANMQHLGTVHSVEQVLQYYKNLAKPSALPNDTNLHLMRYNTYPMWESFPLGGCWLIKFQNNKAKKSTTDLEYYNSTVDSIWEQLVYSAIGEAFADPEMIGVSLSVRQKGVVLSVWNLNTIDGTTSKFAIGEKLKHIVQSQPFYSIEYKYHNQSMRDRSSFRNARPYIIVATEANPAEPLPAVPEPLIEPAETATTLPLEAAAAPFKPAQNKSTEASPVTKPEAESEASPAEVVATEPNEAAADAGKSDEPKKMSFAEMAKRRSNEASHK
jgi:translation initiation factor 4E